RERDGRQANAPANFREIVAQPLVTDHEVHAQRLIDQIESIIGRPVIAGNELTKQLPRLSKLVQPDAQAMVPAPGRLELLPVACFPGEMGHDAIPWIPGDAELEVFVPYLRRQSALHLCSRVMP